VHKIRGPRDDASRFLIDEEVSTRLGLVVLGVALRTLAPEALHGFVAQPGGRIELPELRRRIGFVLHAGHDLVRRVDVGALDELVDLDLAQALCPARGLDVALQGALEVLPLLDHLRLVGLAREDDAHVVIRRASRQRPLVLLLADPGSHAGGLGARLLDGLLDGVIHDLEGDLVLLGQGRKGSGGGNQRQQDNGGKDGGKDSAVSHDSTGSERDFAGPMPGSGAPGKGMQKACGGKGHALF